MKEKVLIDGTEHWLCIHDIYSYGAEKRGHIRWRGKRIEVAWSPRTKKWRSIVIVGDLELE